MSARTGGGGGGRLHTCKNTREKANKIQTSFSKRTTPQLRTASPRQRKGSCVISTHSPLSSLFGSSTLHGDTKGPRHVHAWVLHATPNKKNKAPTTKAHKAPFSFNTTKTRNAHKRACGRHGIISSRQITKKEDMKKRRGRPSKSGRKAGTTKYHHGKHEYLCPRNEGEHRLGRGVNRYQPYMTTTKSSRHPHTQEQQ